VRELLVRSISGVVMVTFALGAALKGGNVFAVTVAAVAAIMYYEWSRIVRGWGLGWHIGGFFYALVPAIALLWLRERDLHGLFLVLWVFIITWATDIGGYVFGRRFGRRKLAPELSPNKTYEGLYGGVAAATLLGGAWALFTGLGTALLLLAPVFAVAAQAGDLFESGMKRRAGVKDSGTWLPGHGGLLDRLDGLVPVAIFTAVAHVAGLT
jgi:phosphatidate cytidylyltransferase